MKIITSKKDVIWNYIGIFFSMGINFVTLPFILIYLDAELIGIWYVYLSVGALVTMFDFGFNPTFARNVAYCWSGAKKLKKEGVEYGSADQPNFNELSILLSTSQIVYLVMALMALIALLSAGSIYIKHIGKEVLYDHLLHSWVLYSISVFLNLYFGYYVAFLRGIGKVASYNKINVGTKLIQIIITLLLLMMGGSLMALATANLIYGFLLRYFCKRSFYTHLNNSSFRSTLKNTKLSQIKEMMNVIWHTAWRDGLVTISRYAASQAGTLVASNYLNLIETGTFSISVQLITAIVSIGGGIYSAYQPSLQSSYALRDKDSMRKTMGIVMFTYFIISIVGIVALLVLGSPLIALFNKETILDRRVIVGFSIYLYFYYRMSYYASFISNTNRIPYAFAFFISASFGIVLSIVFMKYVRIGLWGLLLGMMLPQMAYNYWKWPKMVRDYLEVCRLEIIRIGFKEVMKKIKNIT